MNRMKKNSVDFSIAPEIDTLILFDRKVDLISALFAQLTYEGLIDELFGIQNGCFQPKFECVSGQSKDAKPIVLLNSFDTIFVEIRDLNISYCPLQIKKKSQQVEAEINEKNNLTSVQQIKEYAKKLPRLQEEKKNWETHLRILQQINEIIASRDFRYFVESHQNMIIGEDESSYYPYIQECIDKIEPITKVLRLLCVASLTCNGLKSKTYDKVRNEILQTYGYESILTLNNLEKVGLIKKESKNSFPTIKKGLGLVAEDMEMDEKSMYDIHSVHGGYSPISVRIIEQAMVPNGWKSIKSSLDLLPGPFKEVDQKTIPGKKNVVMVFFIGGVTMSEISAIRYLNRKSNYEFVIATTKLINGNTFLESFFENVGNFNKRNKK